MAAKMQLHWKILIAISCAVIAGILFGKNGYFPEYSTLFMQSCDFVGTLFLNALKLIIVPLITASIITGISVVGDTKSLGRLGLKTVCFYMLTSFLAISVGLILVNLFTPGVVDGQPVGQFFGSEIDPDVLSHQMKNSGAGDILGIFHRLIPDNIVAAAAGGNMLGLIFFSLIFGFFMTKINEEYSKPLGNIWSGIFDTMMLFTIWVMNYLAPVGVFGLVAKAVAETGLDAFGSILWFFLTVMLALAIHMFIILPMLLYFVGKVSPVRHFKAMLPAMVTAFSTSSSSATLPLTIECVEKNAGVSNRCSSFILPLGATVNMDGTALYECVAAIYIAQAYGVEMSFYLQFTVVFLALLTSVGVAGIPSASLVAIVIILGAVGLPADAVGMIMVIDRFLDMCRTVVNIFSDTVATVVIARTEGEVNILNKNSFYDHV